MSAFANDRVLVEKFILNPRHVEIQIFADNHGNIIHLFERDCSLQRRHQKVIEEAPAPGMSREVRQAMGDAAVKAARSVNYSGAGTVEFIADGRNGLKSDGFFFMEMNTRLQVEHPVSEAISGHDFVEWQFNIASGKVLPVSQNDLKIDGHAVEARLYAEDPDHDFLPSSGTLWALDFANLEGIRVDTGVCEEDEVSPWYDPMIAKIIAHGRDRKEAMERLANALRKSLVAGPKTNLSFLVALVEHKSFLAGEFDTGFIEMHLEELLGNKPDVQLAASAGAAVLRDQKSAQIESRLKPNSILYETPWNKLDSFQLGAARKELYSVEIEGDVLDVSPVKPEQDVDVVLSPCGVYVIIGGKQIHVQEPSWDSSGAHDSSDGSITAPMHGKLTALFVAEGDYVSVGDPIFVVEAMKMEHSVTSPLAGKIVNISVTLGDQVVQDAIVVQICPDAEIETSTINS